VILVGVEHRLQPRVAAEDEERVRHRRRAEARFGVAQDPLDQGVVGAAGEPAEVVDRRRRGDQARDRGAHLVRVGGEVVVAASPLQAAAQEQRVARAAAGRCR
jgi:hypothetical protein